ncbi:MAG: HEAT repeat domain-containing protein [Nanoarchaeota archaeon]|nr:HEAT repeat domain-containing protein [Nanoarchaeota archaeon]
MKNIIEILDSGTVEEKIKNLEFLSSTKDNKIIHKIISKLDDIDIKVRGEAFSALVLNENKISDILIDNLKSQNKNIRGYTSLVLANRNDTNSISEIINLLDDQSSMVRASALGALGYLKASEAKEKIYNCLLDSNLEVRKSALQAIINLGYSLTNNQIKELSKEQDYELERLLVNVKKRVDRKGFEPSI